jgi:hypothetical protein
VALGALGERRNEGYLRAEEIGKRLDGWAMARGVIGVLDEEEGFVNCYVAVHDDVVELGWGSSKGEKVKYIRRRVTADLSIGTKLTNAPFLRLLPDSVYDTASLPFYLFTPLFKPEYAAIARRNHSRANGRFWMSTPVLDAMPAFALPISVCSTPYHSRLGNMQVHAPEHLKEQLWASTHRQLSPSQEGSNAASRHQTVVVRRNADAITRPAITCLRP